MYIHTCICERLRGAGRYDAAAAARYLESGAEDEAGSEDAFELLHEIGERVRTALPAPSLTARAHPTCARTHARARHSNQVRTGRWLGDCFVYTNSIGRWVRPLH